MNSYSLPTVIVACAITAAISVSAGTIAISKPNDSTFWNTWSMPTSANAVTVAHADGTSSTTPYIPNGDGCVGMFCDISLKKIVPANSTQLTIIGSVPCQDTVQGWSFLGTFRVFRDGSVQALATPYPPCSQGDYYVWVAYPK